MNEPIVTVELGAILKSGIPVRNCESILGRVFVQLKKYFRAWRDVSFSSNSLDKFEALMDFLPYACGDLSGDGAEVSRLR